MLNSDERLKKDKTELVVIVGPTASGKSALALAVAKQFNGEIISADSWQVYKGFDIGTSKPGKEEQAKVKHHLIDVADASGGFNAPKFKALAEKAIENIRNRGRVPILVGGTGLYIDSVLYDFGFLPNLGAAERAELDSMDLKDLLSLSAVRKVDLSGVDVRNKRRVIRAIEAGGEKPSRKELMSGTLIIGIHLPTEELEMKVAKRVEQMIHDGLEQEVKGLAAKYGWEIEAMKGIGYQQWRDYFGGSQSLDETKDLIVKATLALAKRQWTYLKRNPQIKWFDSPEKAHYFIVQTLTESSL